MSLVQSPPGYLLSWHLLGPFGSLPKSTIKWSIDLKIIVESIGGLQPFPRDSNDKDPGGHVG